MKKIIFLCLAVGAVSCTKSHQPPGPADAIISTYQALELQDSEKFLESLASEKREGYTLNPSSVRDMLNQWKGRHADLKVLSVHQSGDTMATVLYNLTVTGRNPETDDSVRTRVLVENGEWKQGY